MNQTTAARVAASIDGEGCLSRKKWRRKDGLLVVIPTLTITNTAWRLIEWFHDLFGGYASVLEQKCIARALAISSRQVRRIRQGELARMKPVFVVVLEEWDEDGRH